MPVVSYDRDRQSLNINLPNPIALIRRLLTPTVRKYDMNWFAHFLQEARQEDSAMVSSVRDAYRQVAWANIAVSKLASNCSRTYFELYRGDTEITSGPVYDLFANVNPLMSRYQLWEATVSWLFTRGECFWLYPIGTSGIPEAFYIPDPAQMVHHVNKDGEIKLWTREVDNDKIPYSSLELVHFKLWNPWNAYRGVNPLIALDYEIGMDYYASQSNLAMLRNGAIPEGVLTTDNPLMNEDQAREIKDRWMKEHQGSRRAHSIAVLGAGTTYQQIQMSVRDMEYFRTKQWTREAIMAKYGVPLILAGATNDKSPLSGADTEYQMRNFWQSTIIPILQFLEDKIETEFFARHNIDMVGQFDLSEIPELQDDEDAKQTRDLADITAGIRTINEVRADRGDDPVPWGDVWWAPLALSPVSDATEPATDSPPIKALFEDSGRLPVLDAPKEKSVGYTEEFKTAHWKAVARTWVRVEREYRKDLEAWIFGIRSRVLMLMATQKAPSAGVMDEIMDEEYWEAANAELRRISEQSYKRAMVAAEPAIRDLLGSIGKPILDASWSIWNTGAVNMMRSRLDKIGEITKTIREQTRWVLQDAISSGNTDAEAAQTMANAFNMTKNRARTIARTEIGGAINDAEIGTYIEQGFTEIMWLATRDGKARDTHKYVDGNVRKIGQRFANGLIYPHDPDGPAEEVVNCRCLSVPVEESQS